LSDSLAIAGSVILVTYGGLEPKFVTLSSGVRACYVEAGPVDGFPLLLTHGFLGSLQDWRYNTAALAALSLESGQPRRVIALDWIGFGLSDKPRGVYSLRLFADFLKDFVDTLGIQKFDLAGHSAGGKHNLFFALDFPQYIRKMILVATDGFLEDPWWTHQTDRWYFHPITNYSTLLMGRPFFLKAFLKNIIFDPKFFPPEEEIKRAADKLRDPDYIEVLRSMNRYYPGLSLRLTGYFDRLPELKIPVLLLWGKEDKLLSVKYAVTVKEQLPQTEVHLFDQCGHMPQVEKSEEVNRLILDFLNR
jgi:4,5:9,10-diseco-3-hydroxy-5,9,17-trioxoandrosta-1(10),2-diene-4-oate hydrolase